MQLPVQSDAPQLRPPQQIHALGKAIQANLAQLRVELQRRRPDCAIPDMGALVSPGAVTVLREALIDRHHVRAYTDEELHMRLREQWGALCALSWVVRAGNTAHDFGGPLPDTDLHCAASVDAKIMEVHAMLWRLRHELALRRDESFRDSPAARRNAISAARIPLVVQGKTPERCTDAELFAAICEHAGMIAALRWAVRPVARWGAPDLMHVDDRPFPPG